MTRRPFSRPVRLAPSARASEILVWRGRFRWRNSHRIAIVQDLTTEVVPESHTRANIDDFERFIRYSEQHAHSVLTISNHSAADIAALTPINPQRISVLPMPVHPQYENPSFDSTVPGRYGLNRPYVLTVGTIEPRKNLRRLVQAFEALKPPRSADAPILALVGPEGWESGFREFVQSASSLDRVRMLGFVPASDLPSLYHFAEVVAYPSLYEGFGLPVLEAMCSSAVVAASRSSSLPEVLGPGGLFMEPTDADAIAETLRVALSLSPAQAAEHRLRNRARAESHLARMTSQLAVPEPPLWFDRE